MDCSAIPTSRCVLTLKYLEAWKEILLQNRAAAKPRIASAVRCANEEDWEDML